MNANSANEAIDTVDFNELETWNRTRSNAELRAFIEQRNEALDSEDFDFQ